jgi:hypothetical protein
LQSRDGLRVTPTAERHRQPDTDEWAKRTEESLAGDALAGDALAGDALAGDPLAGDALGRRR